MGLLQFFDKGLVGLDIGVSGIKAVELSSGNSRRLMAYNRIALPWNAISADGEIKNRRAVVEALRALFSNKEFTTKRVATAGFGTAIITKKIQVDRMSLEELREQMYWEAEQYIPFDPEDVNMDFAILGNSDSTNATGKIDVLLVAAKKDYIASLQGILNEAGLTPATIDTQAFALGNSFEFNYSHLVDLEKGGGLCILVDFGAGSTKVCVFEGDKTTFSRELRHCGNSCTALVSERLGVSVDQAEILKVSDTDNAAVNQAIEEHVAALVDEISRNVDYCLAQTREGVLDGVFVCGGAVRTRGLIPALTAKLTAPVKPLNAAQNIAGSGKKMKGQAIQEMTYLGAVAIGLALHSATGRK